MTTTRIITISGIPSLLNVLSVLRFQTSKDEYQNCEDFLFLDWYGVSGGDQASTQQTFELCKVIARVWNFKAIFCFPEIHELTLSGTSLKDSIQFLKTKTGIATVDVVYVNRNWFFFNELFLSAYPSAQRICYGDAFGNLDISNASESIIQTYTKIYNPDGLLAIDDIYLLRPVEKIKNSFEFCQKFHLVPHSILDNLIADSCQYIEQAVHSFNKIQAVRNQFTTMVLLANGVETLLFKDIEMEINFYISYILPLVRQDEVILVKGHPRQRLRQSQLLSNKLKERGFSVIDLSELNPLPVEIISEYIYIDKVISPFSAAALSLAYSCRSELWVGAGKSLIKQYINLNRQKSCAQYIPITQLQLQQAYQRDFQPIYYSDIEAISSNSPVYMLHSKYDESVGKARVTEVEANAEPQPIDLFKPLVSLCVPTFNGAEFLAKALKASTSQSYTNLEFIISDDGSSDQTIKISKHFQEDFLDFKIYKHTRYGLAGNWNFCISKASGKYIKFLFQDDILHRDCIEKMVSVAEQDEAIGLVFSSRQIIWQDNASLHQGDQKKIAQNIVDVHCHWSEPLQVVQEGSDLLGDPNLFMTPINKVGEPTAVLLRKDIFEKVGYFDPELRQLIDLEMWLRIMNSYKIGFVNQPLAAFRIHPGQYTKENSKSTEVILWDVYRFYQKVCTFSRLPEFQQLRARCSAAEIGVRYFYQIGKGDYITIATAFQECRQELTQQLLQLSPEVLENNFFESPLGQAYSSICNSQFTVEPLTDAEQKAVDVLISRLELSMKTSMNSQVLMVLLLHIRPEHLPITIDLTQVPSWLLPLYLEYLLTPPPLFRKLGDAGAYCNYVTHLVAQIYKIVVRSPLANSEVETMRWRHRIITQIFSQAANFIPLYFNESNLKTLYYQRAEILKVCLNQQNYDLEYSFSQRPPNRKKIRLGVLSTHFAPSSEVFASLPFYEYLSRDFEVILYALRPTHHALEQYCASCSSAFYSLPSGLREQVEFLREQDLDLLLVATNVTAVSNDACLLASHRLARVQLTSGGSVVTTGLSTMDYYISGTLTDNQDAAQEHYSEVLLKLKGPAQCFSYGEPILYSPSDESARPIISRFTLNRQTLNIAEDTIVFVSGANFFKIIPELAELWARIIAAVPNSILLLFPFGPNWSRAYPKIPFIQQMEKCFADYDIAVERLQIMAPDPVPNRDELKVYLQLADVYLDSVPFAGTTSLIEPLEVGLPTLCYQGQCFRSAMGAAILQSLNLSELIATSLEEYIQKAIALGQSSDLRQQVGQKLRVAMEQNPAILDSRSYAIQIDPMFKEILRKKLRQDLHESLRLQQHNYIVFPDWFQAEELLAAELAAILRATTTHANSQTMTLLLVVDKREAEIADMMLSNVAMLLTLEEGLDLDNGADVNLIGPLSIHEWDAIRPDVILISMPQENYQLMATAHAANFQTTSLSDL